MIHYEPTNETRVKENINGITLIPLLNSILTVKRGYVWITETANDKEWFQRKHKVIKNNSKLTK